LTDLADGIELAAAAAILGGPPIFLAGNLVEGEPRPARPVACRRDRGLGLLSIAVSHIDVFGLAILATGVLIALALGKFISLTNGLPRFRA